MINYGHVIESINIGIVLLDKDLNITDWNNWMALHSGKDADDVKGRNIYDVYPELNRNCFIRGCKTVFTFSNLVFLSSKLHQYLFPFKLHGSYSTLFEFMQQNCYLIPIKDEKGVIEGLMINIHDVTENAVLERHLKELSYIDGLTGAYNRRTFEHRLAEEFNRHKRDEKPLGIIMFDLDFFKNINDKYGHQFGDVVLQQTAKLCKEKLRTEDFLARYGGEEFVCLLINQNVDQTYLVAERLRESLEKAVISNGDVSVSITISIGISDSKYASTPEELIQCADKALYEAKNNGRNTVVKVI
ncbi:diguanylate cyclase with PAS/PAC sensor [Denitrovibrio acetiphilus DSM 12809]|uniref:diguanylate cyclase n=1 Tax=Denitrovibrio acetiphilus (strain DSM 12809 / NBRC 114555 / N2460) TaxID=522772 RepID=D4H1J4_DENA2|nr:sensor domain-containing diguanylate cyclase [Denitrovibrio acetiphilus]ADD68754.1 diguanylate cyclase with PAS/PAC sensor [Denitrovibrio acetiphilus DSM 12809]